MAHLRKQRGFKESLWMFPLAITLHNIEEATWLPAWSEHAGFWHPPVTALEFRIVVTIATLLIYAVTFFAYKAKRESAAVYTLAGFLSLMLINVFLPHLLATLYLGKYAPGVVTGVLLNLPVTLYLLRKAIQEQYISRKKFGAASAVVVIGAILVLLSSFSILRMG
jgi:hypothetical protein